MHRIRHSLSIVATAALLGSASGLQAQQSAESEMAQARVRLDVHGGGRSVLGRPVNQPITGTLLGVSGDTLLLAVSAGQAPLRVPPSAIAAFHVSRGKPNRLEAAVRRALLPTLAAAAAGALSSSLGWGQDGRSAGEAAWQSAGRAAAFSAATGFLFPKERWQRMPLPQPMRSEP